MSFFVHLYSMITLKNIGPVISIPLRVTFSISIFSIFIIGIRFTSVSSQLEEKQIPYLYLGSKVQKCTLYSPEQFYRDVAFPALSTLREETHGFFGILMDKLDKSISSSDNKTPENQNLEKQWIYIMDNIQKSIDATIGRIQNFWGIIVSITDSQPLPWESCIKNIIITEFLNDMEYQYAIVVAIVKAGVKEVVGTLQHQVANEIQKLERHVSKMTKDGENITEMKLLKKMKRSLEKMEPNFIGSLLKKIVKRAIVKKVGDNKNHKETNQKKTFLSSITEEAAIVIEAYRQKGHLYPKFWQEITEIMKKDTNISDISRFLDFYSKNEDQFIHNVIAILTSTSKS